MTVTISGHYDVNAAPEEGWTTDPWELAAIDGFLYGRGVSDCKGPIIATLSAVRELVSKGDLKVNVIFVFDGMNENGCQVRTRKGRASRLFVPHGWLVVLWVCVLFAGLLKWNQVGVRPGLYCLSCDRGCIEGVRALSLILGRVPRDIENS